MEGFQLSLDNLARLCHLASLGNLFGGLIHNLNSPLHSLGMQMDVMHHFLLNGHHSGSELAERVSNRLSKMNIEFENLGNQIRVAGMRADLIDYPLERMDINHFLHQELEFLRANLHFKHNVEAKLELVPSLPALRHVPPYLCLGLELLFERVVEELEKQGLKNLLVGTAVSDENPKIYIVIRDMGLAKDLRYDLEQVCHASPSQSGHNDEISLHVAVVLLKNCAVSFDTELKGNQLSIHLTFAGKDSNRSTSS